MLNAELAGEIVRETMRRLGRNINIMDASGIIIASGDPSRLGQYHAGAAEVIRTNAMFVITEANLPRWKGAQEGINLPVRFHGQVVGAIGITGRPEEVEPFGSLVQMTTELMIKQARLKLQEEWRQMTVQWIVEELQHEAPDLTQVEQRAAALPFRMKAPYQIAVVSYRTENESGSLLQRAQSLPEMADVMICANRPQKLLLWFSQTDMYAPLPMLHRLSAILVPHAPSAIGLSSDFHELSGFRLAAIEAQLAFRMGETESGTVIPFSSVEGKALVHQVPKEHRDRLLAKLLPNWSKRTQETLKALFDADLSIADAVKRLSIHRNTMLYRLEQFKKHSGYDPLRFRDAVLLQFVVWLMESDD